MLGNVLLMSVCAIHVCLRVAEIIHVYRSVNKNLLLIWQNFNVHVLPNLTAVMQAAVCSTKQNISANLLLTVNE